MKDCMYCGSGISAKATLCPICKYDQRGWRNTIVFIAGLAGFLALLSSALAYLFNFVSDIRKEAVWTDRLVIISLLATNDQKDVVLANTGDGPVFVISAWVGFTNVGINALVESGKVVHVSDIDYAAIMRSGYKSVVGYDILQFPSGPPPKPTDKLHETTGFNIEAKKCHLAVATDTEYEVATRLDDEKSSTSHFTFDAEASVKYYALHAGKMMETDPVPIKIILLRSLRPECKDIPVAGLATYDTDTTLDILRTQVGPMPTEPSGDPLLGLR